MLAAHDTDTYKEACKAIANKIAGSELSAGEVRKVVREISSAYGLKTLPKNEHILACMPRESRYRRMLMVKPAKTASGVAIITVMPKPFECPHGRCTYCPGGTEFNIPLSYTGKEPAARVAQNSSFDPYEQATSKLQQLLTRGHNTDKTEIVIVGGTFPFMPDDYQRDFVKGCYDALNGRLSPSLPAAIAVNEMAQRRCVGFTVETKPDYCKEPHIDLMLELGVTRIEIGVQSLRNEVYKLVNRGHTLQDVVDSFRIARDAGYKIVAHMMPGLPGSSPEKDIEDFRRLFAEDAFKPDMLKIYPTLVLRHTGLYAMHESGRYHAYSDDDLVDILVEMKRIVPEYVRIMRVQREIESDDIIAGPTSGNLRQIVLKRLRAKGYNCRCIRCREAGLQNRYPDVGDVVLRRQDYNASFGQETFLSFESYDKKTILGFLRLRKVANPYRKELVDSAVVRELHIYGQALEVGSAIDNMSMQHRGYGIKLMQEAERIAKEEIGVSKIAVISAVGTRQYYKKQLGYQQDGPYVSKVL